MDDFFRKLWNKVKRNQKLDINSETPAEQVRWVKYWNAFELLKKEKKDFIDSMSIYKMGLVTKKDRRWLGDIPYGTNIITYKDRPDVYNKMYWEALEQDKARENAKRREKRRAKKLKNTNEKDEV